MRRVDLQKYERKLRSCRSRLTGEEVYDTQRPSLVRRGDPADRSVVEQIDGIESLLDHNRERSLELVDYALAKIRGEVRGEVYGACERCGKKVTAARLDAMPYARFCVSCQQEVEGEGGNGFFGRKNADIDWDIDDPEQRFEKG